jgi:hypothetical protein
MKDSDYKDKIIELVCNINDEKSLKMIYSLISTLLAIDDVRVLNIAERLILGITRK